MALQLDVRRARIARRWMARSAAGMRATFISLSQALLLALLTVGSRIHLIHCVLDLVAVSPAGVVPASQLPPALSPATPTLGRMAWECCSLMSSKTCDGHGS